MPARGTRTRSTCWSTSWWPSTGEGHAAPRRRPVRAARAAPATTLRFPGKAIALPGGQLPGLGRRPPPAGRAGAGRRDACVRRIGTGERGLVDGGRRRGSASRRVCCCRPDRCDGYDVVVADTVNHALRGVRLADGTVTTVAGTGAPAARRAPDAGRATRSRAVLAVGRGLVATAGSWSRWPASTSCGRRPGDRHRRPGPAPPTRACSTAAAEAWFAQPSGLAGRPDGVTAGWPTPRRSGAAATLRRRALASATAVGQGLFDFGHRDGPADAGAAPAPARRGRAAGRLGRGRRHVQRRGPPLRPGDRAVTTLADRAGRAQRCGA